MILARAKAPQINRLLEDGQTIGPLRVILTPGHTPGSITLQYGPVLFVGDLLRWGRGFKERLGLANLDKPATGASIKKISGLDFNTLCPGHGRPTAGAAAKLREKVSKWDKSRA